MVKLKVTNIDTYIYELEEEKDDKKYEFNLEFINTEVKVSIGDYICVNRKLLDPNYEGYSKMYTFGNMDSMYGRGDLTEDDVDVIIVNQENKEILLKRIYG